MMFRFIIAFCFCYFLKIKYKNIAQTGTERINPSKKEAARQAKNPPIARPILCLIAPQIAGIAPIIAPEIIEPIMAPSVKASIVISLKLKSAQPKLRTEKRISDCCDTIPAILKGMQEKRLHFYHNKNTAPLKIALLNCVAKSVYHKF